MRPRAARLLAHPFAGPDISHRAETRDKSLHELRRRCLGVLWRRNPAASCRNAKDSLRWWHRRRTLDEEKTKPRSERSTSSLPVNRSGEIEPLWRICKSSFHWARKNPVATGSPQDESVRCADLWPVMQIGGLREWNGPQPRGYSAARSESSFTFRNNFLSCSVTGIARSFPVLIRRVIN